MRDLINAAFVTISSYRKKGSLSKYHQDNSWERPYHCNCCYLGFSVKEDLDNHLLIHSVETLFM